MTKKTFDVVEGVLATSVADAATFTVGYPAGRGPNDYISGRDHIVATSNYGELKALDGVISVAFGASLVTITNNTGRALAAGTRIFVQLDRFGFDGSGEARLADPISMTALSTVRVNLGAPITADPNGVCETQAVTDDALLNGALAADGVATFDVPRNVVAAWTTAAVLTVTGTDAYGNVVVESSASGTALTGKKAFKTITAVAFSTAVTGATVGTGDVLGLPAFLPGKAYVTRELEDGNAAAAGTVVAGVDAVATAATGDVRGTYDPNSACNGTKAFALIATLADQQYAGRPQYAG